MTAEEIINFCRKRDILLRAESGKLRYDAPCGAVDQWLSGELHAHRGELMTLLGGKEPPRRPAGERAAVVTQGRLCPHCKSPDLIVTKDAPPPHCGRFRCLRCLGLAGWAPTPEPPQRAARKYVHFGDWTCPHCGSRDVGLSLDAPPPKYGRLTCTSCGRWVGWEPTPPHLLGELWVFWFGRHKGRSLRAVQAIDPEYLHWMANNESMKPRVREAVRQFLEQLEVAADGKDEIGF